jgi:hypothetical protein
VAQAAPGRDPCPRGGLPAQPRRHPAHLRELFATDLVAEASPTPTTTTDNPTEDTTMLLRNATLTAEARQPSA